MNTGLRLRVALHAHGLPGTLSRTGVGGGALAANRQATHVADATIALDALKALQVHAQLAAKIAFDYVAAILNGMHNL